MNLDTTGEDQIRVITVALEERSYPIVIGEGILGSLTSYFDEVFTKLSHVVIIVDQVLRERLAPGLQASLEARGCRVSTSAVPSGETSKSIEELNKIWEFMSAERTDRGSIVVAVGGGVVGDLAGFAAASFARGLRFVQIPTTLLSQVDSSVGGKTGINLSRAKNMVGAFWQPSLVIIDLETLRSLPTREFAAGLAEVVKYGVILDANFFEWLEQHQAAIVQRSSAELVHIIARSCELKAQVVAADEREITGLRAILNYGHTFGHAIEALSGYGTWLHGEAVSMGMTMAARLAVRMNFIPESLLHRQTDLLKSFGLPVGRPELSFEAMWQAMQKDKKVQHGKLTFILPDRLGHVRGFDGVTAEVVREALYSSEW